MGLLGLLNHLLNLVLPAVWLATGLVLLQRVLMRRRAVRTGWGRQWLLLFGAGVAVLVAGLLLLQRDGAMATYIALAVVVALVQVWLRRRSADAAWPSAEDDTLRTVEPFKQKKA